MTVATNERLGPPQRSRDERALEWTAKGAADELAGRTVWCACAIEPGRPSADVLMGCVGRIGSGAVSARRLPLEADEPLRALASCLEAMLLGIEPATTGLGDAELEMCADGIRAGGEVVERSVSPGDVIVLHDPLTALLAAVARERDAHVIWQLRIAAPRREVIDAWEFMRPFTGAADAYLVATGGRAGPASAPEWIQAAIPAPDRVSRREIDAAWDAAHDAGWTAAIAEVIASDREETVGGTLHARPAIASR